MYVSPVPNFMTLRLDAWQSIMVVQTLSRDWLSDIFRTSSSLRVRPISCDLLSPGKHFYEDLTLLLGAMSPQEQGQVSVFFMGFVNYCSPKSVALTI